MAATFGRRQCSKHPQSPQGKTYDAARAPATPAALVVATPLNPRMVALPTDRIVAPTAAPAPRRGVT